MANGFVQLPTPAGNGVGTAVDVSLLGANKTILIGGNFEGVVGVEVSADGGVTFGPVISETGVKTINQSFSADFMRVRISGLTSGTPVIYVGGFETGSKDALIPVTALDGSGAAVDISDFGQSKTIVSSAPFTGSANIEISDDGTNWSPLSFFTGPSVAFPLFYANFIRCRREGVTPFQPNQPVLSIVAADDASDAGSIALSEPAPTFVFRPYDPEGDRDNIYTTWASLYVALQESAFRGRRYLYWDTRYCPNIGGLVGRGFTIPAKVEANGAFGFWDMREVMWTSEPTNGGENVAFADNCYVDGEVLIEGYTISLINDSIISSPLIVGGPAPFGGSRPSLVLEGAGVNLANTAAFVCPTVAAAAINVGDTTITVATTTGFPAQGVVTIGDGLEAFSYTSKNATQFIGASPIIGSPVDGSGYAIGTKLRIRVGCTATSVNALSGATTLTTVFSGGFGAAGTLLIGADTLAYTRVGNVFTVAAGTTAAYPAGTPIYEVTTGNFEAGVRIKPLIKLGGSAGLNATGKSIFGTISMATLPCGTPVVDISGFSLTLANMNVENNWVDSLRATTTTGPSTSITAPNGVAPGATTIPVGSTAAFPASGSLSIAGLETVTYTGVTATSFTGVSPLVHGYGVGTAIIAPVAVAAGATTVNCGSTTGFPASGSAIINQQQTFAYTGVTATSFTGVTGITRDYQIGALIEPSTPAVAAGTIDIVQQTPTAGSGNFTGTASGNLANGMGWAMPRLALTSSTIASGRVLYRSRYRFRVTTPTTITPYQASYNEVVPVNTTGAVTVQLPTASGPSGESIIVKDASGTGANTNNITILPAAGQTIDGGASVTISTLRGCKILVPNGAGNWLVVSQF